MAIAWEMWACALSLHNTSNGCNTVQRCRDGHKHVGVLHDTTTLTGASSSRGGAANSALSAFVCASDIAALVIEEINNEIYLCRKMHRSHPHILYNTVDRNTLKINPSEIIYIFQRSILVSWLCQTAFKSISVYPPLNMIETCEHCYPPSLKRSKSSHKNLHNLVHSSNKEKKKPMGTEAQLAAKCQDNPTQPMPPYRKCSLRKIWLYHGRHG